MGGEKLMDIRNPYLLNQTNTWTKQQVFNGEHGTNSPAILVDEESGSAAIQIGTNGVAQANGFLIANSSGMTIINTHAGINVGSISPDYLGVYANTEQQMALDSHGNLGILGNLFCMAGSQTVTSPTSGSIFWQMPEQGTCKRFVAYADGYENDTTTDTIIDFPIPFNYPPAISTNTTGLTLSVSTTALTIVAPNNTTSYSGVIEVLGL